MADDNHKYSTQEAVNILAQSGALLTGNNGGVIITDTAAHPGLSCCGLYAITATVIAAMTVVGYTGSLATLTIPAGQTVKVQFTSITLTSGSCICYNN